MSTRASPTLIGAFVVGALALAIAGIAVVGSGRLFRDVTRHVLFFRGDVNGLTAGAPVKFKGVPIGSVTNISLVLGANLERATPGEFAVPVLIEIDNQRVREEGADISHIALEKRIEMGLRGQLAMESFVTGVLYVKLDYFPGTPVILVGGPDLPVPEIPTIPTPLEEVQMRASEFLAKLDQIDFNGIATSVARVAAGMDALVNSPNTKAMIENLNATVGEFGQTAKKLSQLASTAEANVGPLRDTIGRTTAATRETLETATALLEHVNTALDPNAPVFYDLRKALVEVAAAAQALRALAESLERNPSAILRGRERTAPDVPEERK